MRILFTGASSFTGMWFAKKLARAGHSVVAAIRQPKDGYSGLRAQRLERVAADCEMAWDVSFGTRVFLDLVATKGPFDLFCHHASEVTDYKSPDFDTMAAVSANTLGLQAVLRALRAAGCGRVILTGTVFEAGEGAGTEPLRAFSPYGLSKTLTAQVFTYHAEREGLALGKFVVANPFGPYEEPRFTEYLMRCWKDGKPAKIKTPLYVRDNVPVSLMAAAYCAFAAQVPAPDLTTLRPSFYVETQGAFAQRFAGEIGRRLDIATPLEFAQQNEFSEPAVRINTDPVCSADHGWSEQAFWDDLAQFYARRLEITAK